MYEIIHWVFKYLHLNNAQKEGDIVQHCFINRLTWYVTVKAASPEKKDLGGPFQPYAMDRRHWSYERLTAVKDQHLVNLFYNLNMYHFMSS